MSSGDSQDSAWTDVPSTENPEPKLETNSIQTQEEHMSPSGSQIKNEQRDNRANADTNRDESKGDAGPIDSTTVAAAPQQHSSDSETASRTNSESMSPHPSSYSSNNTMPSSSNPGPSSYQQNRDFHQQPYNQYRDDRGGNGYRRDSRDYGRERYDDRRGYDRSYGHGGYRDNGPPGQYGRNNQPPYGYQQGPRGYPLQPPPQQYLNPNLMAPQMMIVTPGGSSSTNQQPQSRPMAPMVGYGIGPSPPMYVQLPPPLAAQYGSSADNFYPPRQQYGVPPPIGQYSPALAGSTGAAYVQPPSVSNSAPAAITATAATATTPATPGAAPVPPVPAHLGAIPMIVPLPGIGLVPVLPHVAAREVAPVAKRERKALVIKEKDGSISEINSKAPQPAQPQAPVEPTIPASVPVRVPVPVPVNTSAAEVTVPTQNAPAPAVLEKVSAASGSSVSIEEPVATIAAPVARVQPVEIAAPKTEPPPLATVAAAPDQDEHFHSAKSQHSSQPAEEVLHTQVHTETHILSSKSDAFHSAKSHISTSITPEPTAEATSALPESDVDVDDEGTASSRYESHGYPSSYDNSLVSTREPTPTPSISASPSMESLSSIRVHDQRQALSRTSAAATPEPDSMEDWEKAAADLPALPAPVITSAPSVTPPQRSLRPGGGLGVQKLNIGAQNQPKGPKREYSREEIMKCRPAQQPEKPPILVTLYSGVSENGGNREKKPIVGYWVRVTASTTREYKDKSSDRGQGGQRESGAGGYRESTHRDEPSGGDRWDRGAKQGPVPTQDPRGGRGKKLPPMSRPMKEIADPVEKLSNDVRAILNKITPQTFSKLTEQLCQIPIGTNAMLDKLIELVFEKAVNEPSFANLYSDMCQALENESRHWAFLQIVHLKDTNEYSWIQDLETDNDVAGPFNSPKDAVADVMSDSPKNPVQQTIKVTVSEVIITSMGPSQVLLKIFSDSAVAPGSSQYFISCELFERERIKIADDVYETHESATKQAVKKNSFRNRLLQVCQREFINAVDRSSAYGEVEQVRQRLKETAKSLSEEERNLLESDLEDKEFKAKRRMLGNVRFIGELCKKTLISASVMHHIIKTLTCVMNENDEPIDFKDPVPEHDLEMLCKLMHTSGALLEQDAKKNKAKHGGHFEWYFEKIAALSQDKKYSSRIRFSLDEVLDLRKCSWQARRKEEGPATIDAIHAKVAQEEAAKAMGTHQGKGAYGDVRQQQQFGSPAYGSGAPRGPGGPNKPGSAPKILPRPAGQDARQIGASSPLIGKGVQGKGGYAPSPDARDKGSSSKKGGTSSPAPSQILSRTSAHSKGDQKPASVSTERAAAESAPALSSATTSGSEPLDPKLVKRIASLVSEYARMGDIGEVLLVLAAMPPSALGTVVLASITEYLATGSKAADEEKRERIVSLLKALSDQLAPASELIHTALGGCLELANLNDTIVDCPQAAERLGDVIRILCDLNACSLGFIESLIPSWKSVAVEELEFEQSEVDLAYIKFLAHCRAAP